MFTEIDSKSKIDQNLIETIGILEKNDIPYWLCQGTLLGIIRDDELIPWDHDIDIAVWYSKKLNEKRKEIFANCEVSPKTGLPSPRVCFAVATRLKVERALK